jgi:hypothetical protein
VRESVPLSTVTIHDIARWLAYAHPDRTMILLRESAREVHARTDLAPDRCWFNIGQHLKDCHCANDEMRDMIRRIAYWSENA